MAAKIVEWLQAWTGLVTSMESRLHAISVQNYQWVGNDILSAYEALIKHDETTLPPGEGFSKDEEVAIRRNFAIFAQILQRAVETTAKLYRYFEPRDRFPEWRDLSPKIVDALRRLKDAIDRAQGALKVKAPTATESMDHWKLEAGKTIEAAVGTYEGR